MIQGEADRGGGRMPRSGGMNQGSEIRANDQMTGQKGGGLICSQIGGYQGRRDRLKVGEGNEGRERERGIRGTQPCGTAD